MKCLLVWLGFCAGCGGQPVLPVGLPPPEYERPPVPRADSAGTAPRVESASGGAPTALDGESGTAGLGAAGGRAGAGASGTGTQAGGSQ
jgi:hypothetical protein